MEDILIYRLARGFVLKREGVRLTVESARHLSFDPAPVNLIFSSESLKKEYRLC
jgi:hypothetical protein